MRAFGGVGGLSVCCAQRNQDVQSRVTPERNVLSTEDGTRCLLFFEFLWCSRILFIFRHSGFGLWPGSYFHGPDRGRTHVHAGTIIATDIISFRSAEPIAAALLGVPHDVVHTFRGVV